MELTTDQRHRVLALAREIADRRAGLEREWKNEFRAAGTVVPPPADGPDEAEHLALGGGFRVPAHRADVLSPPAAEFFADRVHNGGWSYLRGLDYYAADPYVHLPGRCPPASVRLGRVVRRWSGYPRQVPMLAARAATIPTPWYDWLAWLAFLEAVLNDLCTARWSAAHLDGPDEGLPALLDDALRTIAGILAEAAWHQWHHGTRCRPGTWADRLHEVLTARALCDGLARMEAGLARRSAAPWTVRAVREGDVLWQVAAAFRDRWPAIRSGHPTERILLVSEAFGAMAVGPLWHGMAPADDRARIELATSRGSVHEAEMGRVSTGGWRSGGLDAAGRLVVHLDDSVFTARTHHAFRGGVRGAAAIYLVTLSFDIGTPFNHPEEILATGRGIDEHLSIVEALTRAPGGMLPAATSLWARRKRATPPGDGEAEVFARVLGGSDRLMATLWRRYAAQIAGVS